MQEFEGRVAIVTGGTKGIGRAIARDLMAAGFRIALTARTAQEVERTAEELSNGIREARSWALWPTSGIRRPARRRCERQWTGSGRWIWW
jgi:NAD(P)-dependent dehydrogenase (short-subunit alcohol dehydrogenase family)